MGFTGGGKEGLRESVLYTYEMAGRVPQARWVGVCREVKVRGKRKADGFCFDFFFLRYFRIIFFNKKIIIS